MPQACVSVSFLSRILPQSRRLEEHAHTDDETPQTTPVCTHTRHQYRQKQPPPLLVSSCIYIYIYLSCCCCCFCFIDLQPDRISLSLSLSFHSAITFLLSSHFLLDFEELLFLSAVALTQKEGDRYPVRFGYIRLLYISGDDTTYLSALSRYEIIRDWSCALCCSRITSRRRRRREGERIQEEELHVVEFERPLRIEELYAASTCCEGVCASRERCSSGTNACVTVADGFLAHGHRRRRECGSSRVSISEFGGASRDEEEARYGRRMEGASERGDAMRATDAE